jgi:hypothetical protein
MGVIVRKVSNNDAFKALYYAFFFFSLKISTIAPLYRHGHGKTMTR